MLISSGEAILHKIYTAILLFQPQNKQINQEQQIGNKQTGKRINK